MHDDPMRRADRLRLALGLLLFAAVAASAADPRACRPEPVQAWPTCSPAGMLGAMNPELTLDVFGNLNPAAFRDGANSDLLPGQASLRIGGRVSAAGAACARHLSATQPEGSDVGISPELAEQFEAYTGEKLPTSDPGAGDIVLQIFSPSVVTWRGSVLGKPMASRHGGIAGWPSNSAANLILELKGTSAGDLAPGRTYTAEVTNRRIYTDWTGHREPRPYGVPRDLEQARAQQRERRICRQLKAGFLALMEQVGIPLDSTRGREMRETDCNVSHYWFIGTRREVNNRDLEARVTINHITDSKVIGEFEVSGRAYVSEKTCRAERHPQPRNPCDVDAGEETVRITGQFQAPNRRNQGFTAGDLRAVTASAGEGSPDAPLQVVSHTPRRDRRNVDWEHPGIRITFSEAVDPESVNTGTVKVGHDNARGDFTTVPGTVSVTAPDEISFIPGRALKDGVRYRVRLVGGGIRSLAGRPLAADYEWPFYTTVYLGYGTAAGSGSPRVSDRAHPGPGRLIAVDNGPGGTPWPADDDRLAPMPGLPDILVRREGIEAHVFQVSRDARLIPGKPTLTRVYAKWREHHDVAPYDQVIEMDATVRVLDTDDRVIYLPRQSVSLKRWDQYSRADIRNADHTVQFIDGWDGSAPQPSELIAEIEPVDQCGEPRRFRSQPRPVTYADESPVLDVDVYFFERGWIAEKAELGKDDYQDELVRVVGTRIAHRGAAFTTENFPVRETRMHFKGPITASTGFVPMVKGDTSYSGLGVVEDQQLTDQVIMQELQPRLTAGDATDSDAVMVLFPPGIQPSFGGYTYAKAPGTGLIGIFLNPDLIPNFEQRAIVDVAHELGHVYHLAHSPRKSQGPDAEADARGVPPIEGFRLVSTLRGWNKSEEEGNEQRGDGRMYALMAEGQTPPGGTFIAQASYRHLLSSVLASAPPLPGNGRFVADGSPGGAAPAIPRSAENANRLIRRSMTDDLEGGEAIRAKAATPATAASPMTRSEPVPAATRVATRTPRLLPTAEANPAGSTGAWRVTGVLTPDGRAARINRVTRVGGAADRAGGSGAFRARLLDDTGAVLAERRFDAPPRPAWDHRPTDDVRPFTVRLPGVSNATTLLISHRGESLVKRQRTAASPTLSVNPVEPGTESTRLAWQASDPDSEILIYDLEYSPDGESFRPLAVGVTNTSVNVPHYAMTPGPAPVIRITATDGFNATSARVPLDDHGGLRVLATGPDGPTTASAELYAVFTAAPVADSVNVVLTDSLGREVAVERTAARGQTVTMAPTEPLQPGMQYTARLDAARDEGGNRLAAPVSWRFTVGKGDTAD